MKLRLVVIASLFLIVLGTSCSKEKPDIGDYYGIFTYDSQLIKNTEIEITESSKNKIVINGSELEKDGKKIEGKIDNVSFYSQAGVYINGEWSHKLFSKNYKIEGTFTEEYYQGGNTYHSSGTFSIKSNE